jgi:hypothetical protein
MIYAHRIQDDNGEYVDSTNQRWAVIKASRILGKRRSYWQEFESLEAALEYWGLTPFMAPDEEDLTAE